MFNQTLVSCFAKADASLAREIRGYLETNCRSVTVQEDAVAPSAQQLLETVERALSADLVLLLLSPDSVPQHWSRPDWEPVLLQQPRELGNPILFVLAQPCRFPEIFRKQKFFDLSVDRRAGLQKLRRWLLEQHPLDAVRMDLLPQRSASANPASSVLAELDRRVGDQPGNFCDASRDAALAFAYAHCREFESAFWIDCRGRTRAGIIGDTAHALGLELIQATEENMAALHRFCSQSRSLFIFDQLAAEDQEIARFGGRASVILTAPSEESFSILPLAELTALFERWRSSPEPCLPHLRDMWQHLSSLDSDVAEPDAQALRQLGTCAFHLLRQQARLAEAYEVLEIMSKHAWRAGEAEELRRWEWERSWIREAWGQPAGAPLRLGAMAEPVQLSFSY